MVIKKYLVYLDDNIDKNKRKNYNLRRGEFYMSEFFLIGDNVNISDECKGLGPFVRIIKKALLPMFYIIIPIALILFGVIDLGKAVIASDEKEIKEAQSKLIKRFIYAALVFLIVFLVLFFFVKKVKIIDYLTLI